MPAILSAPVDTTKLASYFSHLPVHIHKEAEEIDKATFETIRICTPEGSKERTQAFYRHSNPFGSPYALSHSECIIEKLKFFVTVIEIIWMHDDATEPLPYAIAQNEHNILRQALDRNYDSNSDTGLTVGVKKQFLRKVRDEMLSLDPVGTPDLLHTLDRYIREYDSSQENFATVEDYMPYRFLNVGYQLLAHFTRWAMDIKLTDEEMEAVRDLEWTLGGVLGLTNDYFSWKMEKLQHTDRIRNAVPILMRQYGLPQDVARTLLKGIVIDEEEKAKRLRMKLEEGEMSTELKRYVGGLELHAGGNCYWSATCPRYNKPQEEKQTDTALHRPYLN